MPTVHQIWLGNAIPDQEQDWISQVKSHATAAGWNHRLWRDADIIREYGNTPIYSFFTRARDVLDNAVTLTLMSDFFRLQILADHGGLYLDSDFSCTAWPTFPQDGDVWSPSEFFATSKPCNGAILALNPKALSTAAQMAAQKLLALNPKAADFPIRYINLVRRDTGSLTKGIGPLWLRQTLIPHLQALGISWQILPPDIIGHRQWADSTAPLIHHGTAWWHEGPRAKQPAIWKQRAKAALAQTAAAIHAPKPLGRAILPPQPTTSKSTPATIPPPPFSLPRNTRRIVILANTPFNPAEVLRHGDLAIHLNRAKHLQDALSTPAIAHFLLVRKGGSGHNTHWFSPPSFNGINRAIFIDDSLHLRPYPWYTAFKAQGGLSPTTGLIAANLFRTHFPNTPLLLAGFDPAHKHGTPMWKGHSWNLEAAWYANHHGAHPGHR